MSDTRTAEPLPALTRINPRLEGAVRCMVIYNPFDISNRSIFDLDYAPLKPLSAYLDGLPDHVEWHCQLNDIEVPKDGWVLTVPREGDHIVLVPKLHGGRGGKAVFAIVATLVLAVAAPYLGGVIGPVLAGQLGISTALATSLATSFISIVGGLLINALLPKPATPKNSVQSEEDGTSFGVDGPKNVATEGIPVPIVYGQRRVGGNYVQLFTANGTDDKGISIQHLHGQIVLSEGEIEEIKDIEINGQAATTFNDVQFAKAFGTQVQAPGEWFGRTISLFNVAQEMSTSWGSYTTTQPVDSLRVDIVATEGLMEINSTSGKRKELSVPIQIQYRKQGTATWKNFRGMTFLDNVSTTTFDDVANGFRAVAKITTMATVKTPLTARLEYRRVGDPTWIPLEEKTVTIVPEMIDGAWANTSASFTWIVSDLALDLYEVQVINVTAIGTEEMVDLDRYSETEVKIADKTRTQVRRSYHTPTLEQGIYEIQWTRDTPEDMSDYILDKLVVSDIGEVIHDTVALIHTAWLGFKILVSGQLSGIPAVTALIKGVKVNIYDDAGNITGYAWSDNPADIALDIYLNRRYGGALDLDQIDFPAFAEWREFCTENGLTCNMVYDYATNLHDALDHVFTSGRAQRVSAGSRVSVAIDRKDDPVMLFGSGNIVKDSFEIVYLPFEDRINELEVVFPDKNDGYKARSIRVTDDAIIRRGAIVKPATVQLPAITDPFVAYNEAWHRLQFNRVLTRSVSFEAPTEAIGCMPGDVVAVQHDMPKWETGGRLAAGSTDTVIQLDREVSIDKDKSYKILVVHDALKQHDVTVVSQVGRTVFVSGLPASYQPVRRFMNAGKDWGIERLLWGSPNTEILLEPGAEADTFSGAAELWDTDIIEEGAVVIPPGQVNQVETYTSVTVSAAMLQAPAAFSNFMFGEIAKVGREFRVMSISAGSEDMTHKIHALEYSDEIYDLEPPTPEGLGYNSQVQTDQVENLVVREEVDTTLGVARSKVEATWDIAASAVDTYGGAQVDARFNGGQWLTVGRPVDATTYEFEGTVGDVIDVRVTAFSVTDTLAPKQGAPVAQVTLVGSTVIPSDPTGFTATPSGMFEIVIDVDPHPDGDFKHYRLYRREDTSLNTATDLDATFAGTSHTVSGLTAGSTYYFWIEAENTSGVRSTIVGPLSATTESNPSSTIDLFYSGVNDIKKGGGQILPLAFNVDGADGTTTTVDITVVANITKRFQSWELDDIKVPVIIDIRRKPKAGGSETNLTTTTMSDLVNLTEEKTLNVVADIPPAGDWTYFVSIREDNQVDVPAGGSPYNTTADTNSLDLDATIT